MKKDMNQKQKREREKKVMIISTVLVVILELVAAYIMLTGDPSKISYCTPLMLIAAGGTVLCWVNYMGGDMGR